MPFLGFSGLFCFRFGGLFERLFDRPFRLIDRFLGLGFLFDLDDLDLGLALDNSRANAFDGPCLGERGDSGNGSECDFRTAFDPDFDLDLDLLADFALVVGVSATLTDLERTFDLTLPQSALPVCLAGDLAGDFEGDRERFRFPGDRPLFAGDFCGDFRGLFRGLFWGLLGLSCAFCSMFPNRLLSLELISSIFLSSRSIRSNVLNNLECWTRP